MARDIDLLISFKNSLSNPNLLSNWNHMHGVCEFQGVTCKGSHVSSLTIRGQPLEADFNSVSAHLLSLGSLESLSLHSTSLTGSISSLASCTMQLKELDLSSNNLRGSIYDTASLAASCHSLESLNLSNNYIGQAFNRSSPVFAHLKMLDLSTNKITTTEDIQWLFDSKIWLPKHLDLSNNSIKGTIPKITNCTSLQYLDLSSNQLNGTIPAGTFSGCLKLTYLNLSSNHFTGMAPPDIEACTNLINLSLSKKIFSGVFPMLSMVATPRLRLISLESLDLSANRFSGPIPRPLCTYSVSRLEVLYLQDNYFTGTIPHSLCNCTNLVSLDLSLNFLFGSIPNSLGSLSNLKDIIMWQNNLHGEIPAELSSLNKSLKNLVLDYNNLTGAITDGNNSFIGSIPLELGNCKDLVFLDLSSNQLNGSIPSSLAKQFGKIVWEKSLEPQQHVSFANPENSQCHSVGSTLEFDGIRMDDLMRLPSTQYCNFTRVYLGVTRIIDRYLNNNISIIFLDLSYNQLEGPMPIEISTIKNLIVLNLKHNRLSGPLPQELGGLIQLSLLDLSHNTFEGSIPSSFSVLSLTTLDLSNNRLSGPIPELGSLITFLEYVFENNSGLCGLPLPPCNDSSIPKGDVPQQSSTNHGSSQGWWIALGLLIFIFSIIGFIIGQFLR
ncbi:brassinosteroid LRR receptor kinase BRI1-like [Carex rostrata]